MNGQENEELVTGTVGLKIDDKRFEMQLTVPANAVHPRRVLPVFQQITNMFVESAVNDEEAAGRTISCKAGCGACCRQLVPVSQLEARHLSDVVAEMPAERQAEIRRRFAAALETLDQAGMLATLREPDKFPDETVRETGLKYFSLGIACPFLEDESCSIHPVRPLACREYLVTSPAENCAKPTAETVRQIPIPAKVSNAVILLSQPKEGSRYIPYVPMVLALDFAENTPDEMPSDTGPNILKRVFNNLK